MTGSNPTNTREFEENVEAHQRLTHWHAAGSDRNGRAWSLAERIDHLKQIWYSRGYNAARSNQIDEREQISRLLQGLREFPVIIEEVGRLIDGGSDDLVPAMLRDWYELLRVPGETLTAHDFASVVVASNAPTELP